MKPSTGSESWEERFMEFCKETAGFTQSCDEQYCEDFNVSWNELAFIDDMKKFIATEVAHAKAEARREVVQIIDCYKVVDNKTGLELPEEDSCCNETLNTVIKAITTKEV